MIFKILIKILFQNFEKQISKLYKNDVLLECLWCGDSIDAWLLYFTHAFRGYSTELSKDYVTVS